MTNINKLFSEHIDDKKIKTTANKYGFSAKKIDSSDFLIVKTKRNNLAHGIKSFAEVGKEKGADEFIEIKNKVVKYLRQILENIETYLDNQEYLDSSTNYP
ncbi:MAG: MAE_28990/MAE_18760 family HEPN-like nuclease [Cyanobacteria bacterium P01_H01_bin.35]